MPDISDKTFELIYNKGCLLVGQGNTKERKSITSAEVSFLPLNTI